MHADSAWVEWFGFREAPFLDSPDERFVYQSASLTHVVATVLDRIDRGDRLIVVTGMPGIGKTTLCMELARQFRTESVSDRAGRIRVIDEADLLGWGRLRELLRDPGTVDEHRTRTVLVGGPSLEESLERAGPVDWERIHRIQLGRLHDREIINYIERRMWVARGGIASVRESIADDVPASGPRAACGPRFSARAIRRLRISSRGNPRDVNAICTEALKRAADRRATRIRAHLIGRPTMPSVSLRPVAWCTIGIGFAALAVVPSVYSMRSSARSVERSRMPAPLVRSDESFEAFRKRTLQRAAELATVPDVNELLGVRDEVLRRGHTSIDRQRAIEDLLTEVDQITNQARARQLELDHRQMLESVKHD